MRSSDAILCALEDLRDHKLRSGLTMLGMMFGVGAVIAMLSIGAGAEQQSLAMIDQMGVRNVIIRARDLEDDELKEIRKQSAGLSERDITAMREALPQVSLISPRALLTPYNIRSSEGKSDAKMYGVGEHHAALTRMRMAEGRFLDALDTQNYAQVCVLGEKARRDLFGGHNALGAFIQVNDQWLEVIGVTQAKTSSLDTSDSSSNAIFVPYGTLLRKFDRNELASPLHEILLQVQKGASPADTAAVAKNLLERLHGGVSDYDIMVPEALLEQSRQTQSIFNIVMGCIAGISLFVGGIGIMNIMLASVLEQTREIGIRRAVGARRRDVRFQFLVSAFALSFFGGILGIILGLGIAKTVASYAEWPTLVTFSSIVDSTGVSMLVGLLSGLYPAIRASNLQPIEALHHE